MRRSGCPCIHGFTRVWVSSIAVGADPYVHHHRHATAPRLWLHGHFRLASAGGQATFTEALDGSIFDTKQGYAL